MTRTERLRECRGELSTIGEDRASGSRSRHGVGGDLRMGSDGRGRGGDALVESGGEESDGKGVVDW